MIVYNGYVMRKELQLVLNTNGRPTAVVLPLWEYRKLLRRIEELEDVQDLKRAVKTAGPLLSASELRARLKQRGLL